MRFPFWRKKQETELRDEINNHLEQAIRERIERGESPEQAEVSARRELGSQTLVMEVTRQMWGWASLERLIQDLRHAIRILMKRPTFTGLAVITLVLGIGTMSALFNVIYGVILRPLPFQNSEQLIKIQQTVPDSPINPIRSATFLDFKDWKARNHTFENMATFITGTVTLTSDGEPEVLKSARIDSDLFNVLKIGPAIGRGIQPEEDLFEAPNVVVLSHDLWVSRYGADPAVVGRTIATDLRTLRVIGVMPPGFNFPDNTQLWTNLQIDPQFRGRRSAFYLVIARLKTGATLAQAQADMDTLAASLAQEYPDTNKGRGISIVGWHADEIKQVKSSILILGGAALFVLLIACANVANLMLTRTAEREREIAIRAALGAGRWRLVRQLLSESLLLSVLGGGMGVVLSLWVTNLIVKMSPVEIPYREAIGINWLVLGFAISVSMLTGIMFGILPGIAALRVSLNDALKQSGKQLTGAQKSRRLRSMIVVVEMSLTLVLLVSAGLLIRSFHSVITISTGYVPDGTLTLPIDLSVLDGERANNFLDDVETRVRAVPGVKSVSGSIALPQDDSRIGELRAQMADGGKSDQAIRPSMNSISPDYFQALGIPLLKGRAFNSFDTAKSGKVAIISEALAKELWPDQEAIGKRFFYFDPKSPWEVVGVVGNTRKLSLSKTDSLQVYLSLKQFASSRTMLVIRTEKDPEALIPALRVALKQVDKKMPLQGLVTMNSRLSKAVTAPRFYAVLMGSFSAIAILLALVGLYGVISHSVTLRTQELGIRAALGAQSTDILKLVVGQGLWMTGAGLAIGIPGALAVTRTLKGLLYGITPTDPTTFAGIAVLVVVVALLACWIPARRAAKIDPMVALRYE